MKHLLTLFLATPALASTFVTPGDAGNIPGVESFSYDHYYSIGNGQAASLIAHTDAYSWDHPNLASDNPALGNQTGWTHLTQWVALSLAEPMDLTIRIAATSGVLAPDQNNPGEFVEAGDSLIPAFTLWSGFEVLAENGQLGIQDPAGGHRWDNDGDETFWADQLQYVAHEGNEGGASSIERTLSLAAGDYTINIAGHQPGAFDPAVLGGQLRQGFDATFTAVPEPGSATLAALALGLGCIRRRR